MATEELVEYLKRQLAELGFIEFLKNNRFVPTSIKLLHNVFHPFMNSKLGPIYPTSHTHAQEGNSCPEESVTELETTEGNSPPQTP